MIKVVHPLPDEPSITVVTTFADDLDASEVAENLEGPVGKGNPFLAFETIPQEIEANIAADFTGAPECSNKADENEDAIRAMLADPPLDKLSVAS